MPPNTQFLVRGAFVFLVAAGIFWVVVFFGAPGRATPLEVVQYVRNASAKEIEWQVATTAQPGDVLEHFALIRLPQDYTESVRHMRITADASGSGTYRPGSFISRSLGIADNSLADGTGVAVAELKPGEFIDLSWQTSIAASASFKKGDAPLMENMVRVVADGFSDATSRTVATLFSTVERARMAASGPTFFQPKAYSMNPRNTYEDLGGGVLIAGEDLEGVTRLAIQETGRTITWRLVSNELLEASIPGGLAPGEYGIELFGQDNKPLKDALAFAVAPSSERAVVVASTPSIVRSGERRTIVLQGIHLNDNLMFALSAVGSKEQFILENVSAINGRVLTAEVAGAVPKGDYTILVGGSDQEAHITVN